MGDIPRQEPAEGAGLARRQFLVKAAVAGTVAWAVPTMITVGPAGASGLTSPPPTDVEGTQVEGTQVEANVGVAQVTDPDGVSADQLPHTGTEPDDLLKAGLAATAGGAAILLWSADSPTRPPIPDS